MDSASIVQLIGMFSLTVILFHDRPGSNSFAEVIKNQSRPDLLLDIIALVVRLYPKQNPYENNYYQKLAPYKKVLVSKLTAILRIADALDSSHKQKSKKVTVQLNPESLHISCESDADMSFEMWSFEHRSGLFEEVIGIKPELRIRRTL